MHGQNRHGDFEGEQLDDDGEQLGDPPYPSTGEQLPDVEIATPSVQRRDVLPPRADDAAAIDSFLSGYGRGFQVSIVRTAPVWCAGYLTTLPMDHGITLNEIRESYGGRRFQLRILTDSGKYVAMRTVLISDIPRDDGKPIATLDRGTPEAPRANPAAAPSGFGELAGVLRDLMSAQQAASERQHDMLERLISNPAAQVQAAIASPLQQIKELGEVIAAVRDMTPAAAVAEGGGLLGGAGGEDLMMKLAEKLITKWGSGGDKKAAAAAQPQPPGRAPGARRAPIIIQGPRPAGIPAPRHAPIVPNPTTIAAMQEARTMGQPAAVPIPVPIPAPLDTPSGSGSAPAPVNNPATVLEAPDDGDDGDEYTAEDVRDLLAGMPVDDAAEVIRDVFDGLDDEGKQRAVRIMMGQDPDELAATGDDELDNSSTGDQ